MLRGSIQALAIRLMGTAIWVVLTLLLARMVSQEAFGELFFLINLTILGGTVLTLGYDVITLRFGSPMWAQGETGGMRALLGEGMGISLGASVLLAAVLLGGLTFGVVSPVTASVGSAALVVVAIFLTAMIGLSRDMLRASDRLRRALIGEAFVRTLVFAVLAAALLLTGQATAIGLFALYVVALLLTAGLQVNWVRQAIGGITAAWPTRAHLPVALAVWPGTASGIIVMRAPGLFVGMQSGLVEAALFFAADRVAQLSFFLVAAVRTAVAPELARAEASELQETIARTSALMLLSGIFGLVAVMAFGTAMLWALGPNYYAAFPTMVFLLIGNSMTAIFGPFQVLLNMRGRERIASAIVTASAVLLVVLLLTATSAQGAAMIFAGVQAVAYAMGWLAVRRTLGVSCGMFAVKARHIKEVRAEFGAMARKLTGKQHRK